MLSPACEMQHWAGRHRARFEFRAKLAQGRCERRHVLVPARPARGSAGIASESAAAGGIDPASLLRLPRGLDPPLPPTRLGGSAGCGTATSLSGSARPGLAFIGPAANLAQNGQGVRRGRLGSRAARSDSVGKSTRKEMPGRLGKAFRKSAGDLEERLGRATRNPGRIRSAVRRERTAFSGEATRWAGYIRVRSHIAGEAGPPNTACQGLPVSHSYSLALCLSASASATATASIFVSVLSLSGRPALSARTALGGLPGDGPQPRPGNVTPAPRAGGWGIWPVPTQGAATEEQAHQRRAVKSIPYTRH